jgi:hypothetical protein
VTVDLGSVLASGDEFRIVSVQNVFGEPIVRGTYRGPLTLPMKPTAASPAVGLPNTPLPVTEPEFGVFLVLPDRPVTPH